MSLKDKLSRPVAFRLTDKDHSEWIQKVEQSGLKPSEFFRECVLKNKTQIIAKPRASRDRRRLLYLFNSSSNNINQLARAANGARLSGRISESLYSGILAELQALSDSMKDGLESVD